MLRRLAVAAVGLVALGACVPLPDAAGNVPAAQGHRYGSKDNTGATLDGLKIIQAPGGDYLGVYHVFRLGRFETRVATSSNLLTWTYWSTLGVHDSQATIAPLGNGYVVASESNTNGITSPSKTWIKLRRYPSGSALLAGDPDRTFDTPHTLVPANSGAEGTPNIYSASNALIDVGMHYFRNSDVDRQARGTLRNWSTWTTKTEPHLDRAILAVDPGLAGNIGDRDDVTYGGDPWTIHEGQLRKGDFSSWRCYLVRNAQGRRLTLRTHGGSVACANPTTTLLRLPNGKPGLVTTVFIPMSGAAPGEAGELIFYREV
jgi:hypothetical protein